MIILILKEKINGFLYQISIENDFLSFSSDRCNIPLRVYFVSDGKLSYAGLSEPSGHETKLSAKIEKEMEEVLITDGRIEDKHSVICRFTIKKEESYLYKIFSYDSVFQCIRQFKYFQMFTDGEKYVFAFPTDFDQHPLLHLIPYSYWYKSCEKDTEGYCFVAVDKYGKITFPYENILTETGANSII